MDTPAASTAAAPTLRAVGITKHYGGVEALRGVDAVVSGGRVTALVGENGAGKSTLVRVLAGAVRPDRGLVTIDDHPVEHYSTEAAGQLGIEVVHQAGGLADDLTITENVFLGREVRRGRGLLRPMNRRAMAEAVAEPLGEFAPELHGRMLVRTLSPRDRRIVTIVRALVHRARFLILDEPTAALPVDDRTRLLAVVRVLRDRGLGILYVSHHIDEIRAVADDIIVLRDGRVVGVEAAQIDSDRLIGLMLGRELATLERPTNPTRSKRSDRSQVPTITEVVLELTTVSPHAPAQSLRLPLHAGRVTILTGLAGSGASAAAAAVAGLPGVWKARVNGDRITAIRDAQRVGIAYLSSDRIGKGVLGGRSVRENITISVAAGLGWGGWRIDRGQEDVVVHRLVDEFGIRLHSIDQDVLSLSGGNQQKCLLARLALATPRVLVLDEPTQGIDVGAKVDVLRYIEAFVQGGGTVLLHTSDAEEYLHLASDVHVMRRGSLAAAFTAEQATATKIAAAAMGGAETGIMT